MIEDAEQRSDDRFAKTYDVCIIGSGPAGVTLARRLGAKGLSVGLFEGGGLDLTTDSQELYEGTETGQPYYPLDATRLRYFGGSSNHWGGWTHKLDPYDFAPNPDNPLSGWPITLEEPGWVIIRNPDGGIGLNFQEEGIYERPVWPARQGAQQMQMHLEIMVDDLEAASAHAQACGATLADFQPQETVRVHLDPDGHPFCLYLGES